MMTMFEEALKEYLQPYEKDFNYQNMLQGHLDISRFSAWISQAADYRVIEGAHVLSSGCGSGGDLLAFMAAGAGFVNGIEVNLRLANLAKIRFSDTEYQSKASISMYDGNVLPFENNSFDIVFSAHVLEHTQNPSKYLEELCRVLKSGGIIFLDIPNRYFSLEQHTLIKYIHYLPLEERNRMIRFLLSKFKFSDDLRFRLSTLVNFHFLSPAQIIEETDRFKEKYHLILQAAYFHSYGEERIKFRIHPMMYLFGKSRRMNTFRIVIQKIDG